MDYSRYDIADFAADHSFVSWVLAPNEQSDAFWNQWISDHPEQSKTIYEAKLLVLLMNSRREKVSDDRKEMLWQNIQQRAFDEVDPTKKMPTATPLHYKRWLKIAAAIIFLALSIVYYKNTPPAGHTIVINEKGKKSVLYLPDGTKVWLNAESKLSYPNSFEDAVTREVILDGEAYFDVTENKSQPFIVKTSQLDVKVLGTSFNVRSYKNQKTIETTLVEGSVMIALNSTTSTNNNGEVLILKENERAVYSTVSKAIERESVKTESATSWKEGKLIFLNKPFSEIQEELERWYGVEIVLENETTSDCRFTTTIENEPINKILDLFKTTSGIRYEINNNTIIIKGTLCADSSPVL